MRLRVLLGRAAAVLSIATLGAAVAAPAQAIAYDRYLSVSVSIPDADAALYDGLTFEIFDGTGALVFEIDATTPANAVAVEPAGECYVYVNPGSGSTQYRLNCGDLPAGDYIVGAAADDPSVGFRANCATNIPPEPALDGTGRFTLDTSDDINCNLSPVFGGIANGFFGPGYPAYGDTAVNIDGVQYRLTNDKGLDRTFDSPTSPSGDRPACSNGGNGASATFSCYELPAGTYTLEGAAYPDGAVVGELTCTVSTDSVVESTLRQSSNGFVVERAGDFVVCSQYVGTGIPIFVDVDASQVNVPLADIVVEIYDEEGTLVAEGTDPSEASCIPVGSIGPGDPYALVSNPGACAVLMVAPPSLAQAPLDASSTSYSIGLRGPDGALGASAASAAVSYKDVSILNEPVGIEGSTATLAITWDGGPAQTIPAPSGAIMSVTAETIVLAAPQLPDTGPTAPWIPTAAAGSAILVGAFLLLRRRAQV